MKGILSFISAVAMVLPALAGESEKSWDLYGSARIHTAYWDRGFWYRYEPDTTTADPADSAMVYDPMPWNRNIFDLQPNSRFGAFGKKGNCSFRFEVGWAPFVKEIKLLKVPAPDYLKASKKMRPGLFLRRLYGEWQMTDNLALLVGQEWGLTNFLISSQVFEMEAGLTYCGALFTGRSPQIKLGYNNKFTDDFSMKAEFALLRSDTATLTLMNDDPESEERMPKMEVGIEGAFNKGLFGVNGRLVAGYNEYDIVTNRYNLWQTPDSLNRTKISCYVAGGVLGINVWKAKLTSAVATGKNVGAYGVTIGDPEGWRKPGTVAMGDVNIFLPMWDYVDTNGLGAGTAKKVVANAFTSMLSEVLTIQPLEWLGVEAGYGLILTSHEAQSYKDKEPDGTLPNLFTRYAFYRNAQIKVGPMLIIPEYTFSDLGPSFDQDPAQAQGGLWSAYSMLVQFDF